MSHALTRVAVGAIAFLTLVDLFGAQAVLPTLAKHYQTSPAMMGVAVNACALGMAAASLVVATFSSRIDRRLGVVASLVLLTVPTALLAHAPDLATFTALRVAQGLCMATAFTLTLAYLGEHYSAMTAAAASAAYITGNVASNLVGRMLSAGVTDHFGLSATFYTFAALNISGAVLAAYFVASGGMSMAPVAVQRPTGIASRLGDRSLALTYGIGFCILFAFIGTFTYVNFVLMRPPIGLDQMQLGLVYLVFLPAMLTTPQAGRIAARLGAKRTLIGALVLACVGLLPLLGSDLGLAVAGLALVAVGTFLAQAAATGFVSMTSALDRGSASGLYLGSYFLGGLSGAAVLGFVFERLGWTACVAGIASSLVVAALLATRLDSGRREYG